MSVTTARTGSGGCANLAPTRRLPNAKALDGPKRFAVSQIKASGIFTARFPGWILDDTTVEADLKAHVNDRLGDDPHSGYVVAGVPARQLVALIGGDRVRVCRDSLGLFDDDS